MIVDQYAARPIGANVRADKNFGFHYGNPSRKNFRRRNVSLANLAARASAIQYRALNFLTSVTEFTGCWRDVIETTYSPSRFAAIANRKMLNTAS
jgi:hypothetical protein